MVPVQKPQEENMILNQSEDFFATAERKDSASRLQPKYNLKTSQEEIRRHLAIPANKDHCSKEIPRIWNWLLPASPGPTIELENFAGSHSRLSIRLRCRCYGASWTAPSTTHLCCTYRGMISQSFLFLFAVPNVRSFQQIEICSKKSSVIFGAVIFCWLEGLFEIQGFLKEGSDMNMGVFWEGEKFAGVQMMEPTSQWMQHQGHVAKGTVEMEVRLRLVDTREGFPL